MKFNKTILRRNFGSSFLLASLFVSLCACASQQVAQDQDPAIATASSVTTFSIAATPTKNNSVSGIIVSSDDSTPQIGITVYIAATHTELPSSVLLFGDLLSGDLLFGENEHSKKSILKSNDDLSLRSIGPNVNNKSCQKPSEPYVTYTCTNYWGAFYLNIANLRDFPVRLKVAHQHTTQEILLSLNDIGTNLGQIKLSSTTKTGFGIHTGINKQKIAIVTELLNPYKEIQNSLRTDSLDLQSMKLEIAEGFYELYEVDAENSIIEFPSFESLFSDKDNDKKADIYNYEVVYINSLEETDIAKLSDKYKRMLIDFVSKGGELYITSWSFELQEPGIENYI